MVQLEGMVDILCTNHKEPEDDPFDMTGRSVRQFVDLQTFTLVYGDQDNDKIVYTYIPMYNNAILEDSLYKQFTSVMKKVIVMSVYIDEYEFVKEYIISRYISLYCQ